MIDRIKPKLAFFDIDGTLLGSAHLLSARTVQALNKLKEAGVLLALATGRPSFGARVVSEKLDIDCWSLFFSGALISNPKSGQHLYEAAIDKELIRKVIKLSKDLGLYLEMYTNSNYYVESFTDITPKHSHYMGFDPTIASFEELIEQKSIIKLLTASEGQQKQQEELIAKMPELKCLCSTGANHPDIIFNNITALSANRVDGFQRIISEYNIKAAEVISFGDAVSDIDFLKLSGMGVAMANASDIVKQSADYITDTADNDGVAKVIEQVLQNFS